MNRWFRRLALALLMPLFLGGCSGQPNVEARAYALALAMDVADGGGLTLTACVPRIGKSFEGGDGAKREPSPYMFFSATGPDYAHALSALKLSIPRVLNLSHIVLLAVSEALAADARFPELVNQLAETRNLYTATRVVVCPGGASAFIRREDTLIGARLSHEIDGAMTHYAALGAIPDTCLADLYYASNSIYGDIAVAVGRPTGPEEGAETSAGALVVPDAAGVRDTPGENLFFGGIVFSAGRARRRLDPMETLCLCLMNGSARSLCVQVGGRPVTLAVRGSCCKQTAFDGERVRMFLRLGFSTPESLTPAERSDAETAVSEAIVQTVHACQARGLDPFGFGERAARRFATVGEWQAYDWRSRYAAAPLTVRVSIRAG